MNRNSAYSLLLISLLILSSSCGNSADQKNEQPTGAATARTTTVKNMYWLEGWWENNVGGVIFEEWKINADGTLSGTSGLIDNKDTLISETISLKQGPESLMYIPTVKDQNDGKPVPFTLTIAAGDSFVFENPQHDFPSKITYKKLSASLLTATISGKVNGEQRSAVIEMKKAQ